MGTNPRLRRRRSGLLATTSAPGLIGALVVVGHPLLDLLIVIAAAALLLVGYVITVPSDQPFRRVHALLCLLLNRSAEFQSPPQPGPKRES
jgi:hypothetical protein